MPITEQDIKLLKSARMTDTPDGGGRMTGNVVTSGVDNNIFDDVSNLDRVHGNVSLRKVFPGVLTNTTDKYLGSRVIIDEAPADPNIHGLLFDASSLFDVRDQAKARVEAYLAAGAPYQGLLYGPHIVGMMSVLLFQQKDRELPGIGDTLLLRKTVGVSTTVDQYVRITSVTGDIFNFTDGAGAYERRIVTCTIGDALRYDFNGWEATRTDSGLVYGEKARVYTTLVANAAQYYGISPLATPALTGAYNIKAESSFSPLVPSAQVESPLLDLNGTGIATGTLPVGTVVSSNFTGAFTTSTALTLGSGITPGTLVLTPSGGTPYTDTAAGVLMRDGVEIGAVDHPNGVVVLSDAAYAYTGSIGVQYQMSAKAVLSLQSTSIPVTLAGRSMTYVASLHSLAAPKTLVISYLSNGKWYTIKDRGDGTISGASAGLGAGNINYTTRSVSMTLGALPDVGSHIILQWGMQEAFINLLPEGQITMTADLIFPIGAVGPAVESFSASWNDGTTKTIGWSLAGGYTGSGGTLAFLNGGGGGIKFDSLPAKGTSVTFSGQQRVGTTQTYLVADTTSFTLPSPPIRGSLVLPNVDVTQVFTISDWLGLKTRLATLGSGGLGAVINFNPTRQQVTITYQTELRDNGNGALVCTGAVYGQAFMSFGTIDYATGVVAINPTVEVPFGAIWDGPWVFGWDDEGNTVNTGWGGFQGTKSGHTKVLAQTAEATYTVGSLVPFSGVYTVDTLRFPLQGVPDGYTLDSLTFNVGGVAYQRDTVTPTKLVKNANPFTGAGAEVGQVLPGLVTMTDWPAGMSTDVTEFAAVASRTTGPSANVYLSDRMVFRTPTAPLRPGGFTVQGRLVAYAGGATTAFSVTPDATGVINTSALVGYVDFNTGICFLYGRAAGVTVDELPNIPLPSWLSGLGAYPTSWQPGLIVTASVTYNAVSYTYLPLDASVLGLDPVRLPSDGRVPIFKAGRVVVVHNTVKRAAETVSNGQTIDCGRTRLARIRVFGADGLEITSGFSKNLDAGTITFTNVAGMSQPVVVEHRIEDEALCADAQITGDLRLTRPLTHDFPADTSYVSSALVKGTLQAAAQDSFAQETWTSVWSDLRIGNPMLAAYNDTANPIAVTNAGAITERWLLQFTNNTEFVVVGEEVGQIITGNTATTLAPVNPATGVPYFTLAAGGWGAGWVAGNVLRFNTAGAGFPLWVSRTVMQSPSAPPGTDQMTISIRGDIDQ